MSKKLKYSWVILSLIILIGFFLRIIFLNQNPPAMHADEADSGYTALTLIKTGMDPYGHIWPLQFQDQANNYRAPLYTYSVIPVVMLFGLNPISERLPSVLFGVLFILSIYFILKIYFQSEKIALVGAFIIAINPWAIHISRTGLEVQLSVLLTTLGILFFERSNTNKFFLIYSSIFFVLSLFSYHPAKIFAPLILVALFLFNFSYIKKMKAYALVAFSIFMLGIVFLGYLALFEKGASHFNEIGIIDNTRAKMVVDSQRTQTTASLKLAEIFSNKPLYFFREFANMYIGPLSVNYLFVNGESNLDKGMGNYGQYHFFELLPLIIGFFALWNRKKKIFFFLLTWFLVGFIPAGITRTGNYAYRDINALVPLIIFVCYGFVEGYNYLSKQKKEVFIYGYAIFTTLIFIFFLYNYYFAYPVYSRDWWGYSQKEALEYLVQNKQKYTSIAVQGGLDWAVLYAFYYNVPPKVFQKEYKDATMIKGRKIMQLDGIYFGNIIVDSEKFDNNPYIKKVGLLITPYGYFKNIKSSKVFSAVDGGTNLNAYEIKK